MMTKEHTITIEGLPEGWKAVAFAYPKAGEHYHSGNRINEALFNFEHDMYLIVQKTKPRRIVLEETEEIDSDKGCQSMIVDGVSITICGRKIWREVKEES